MKQLLTSLAILLATITSFAQAPNRISYQAEVRNGSNNLVVNQLVGIRISILQGSNVGASAYTETHTPTTNANGLVSLQIGGGTVVSGGFATINWGNGPYFLKTETDPAGGTNYSITGTNQLLSVPYALFSNASNNGVPSGGSEGQVLTNCGGVAIWTTGGICPGSITALACSTATNTGTLTQGIAATSVSSSIAYTGGNGGLHNGQTVSSTGVTGLTATLTSGSFASGAGSLTYTITGTPASGGTASFALNIGGQTCILTRTVAAPIGTITALTCGSAANIGTLTRGEVAASVSSSVPYTGGNGGTHSGQTVNSTGVTGLTATLTAGNFAIGAGSLTYTITGTPATSGTASFALNIGGKTCTLTRTVALPVGTITALSCSTATNSGTLGQGVAAVSVSSTVPYTGGNGGTHTGQIVTSTGVTGLTATRALGNFATGSGTLVYTITGTPASSGTASFALNIGGQTCTLTRIVLASASITALNCSTATNNGTLGQGVAAASVSSSVPYTGGNGGYRAAQTFTSTGVTGLTATCAAGTLANGAGNLTFTITGTPATSGTASFALNIGGQTCTLTRTVLPTASITALSCSTATNNGTLTQGIAAASVNSSVPYTGGNGGYRAAQTFTSTGVTGLTATCAAGTLATGAGSFTFTITGTPASSGTASFALNIGGQTCTLTRTVLASASITALSCSTATNNGTLTQGTAAASVNSSVPYTGGNGGYRGAQTVTSTGVTGLTATCAAGTLANGAGSLTFTITGTPASNGTASFALNIGGQTCTLTRTVNPPAGTITTLSCSTPIISGALTQGITAVNVSSTILYSGGNAGPYSAQAITSTGVLGLTASLMAGNFASGAGTLTYSITGAPATSGTASFALNIGGQTCSLTYTVNALGLAHSCGVTNVHNTVKTYGSMTDQQGNVYKTIVIGSQEWMAENLKTTIYRNGNTIANITDDAQWSGLNIGAWAFYNNDSQFDCPYGKLYNWYAVADPRSLCPIGWKIPSDGEWSVLINYLDTNATLGVGFPNVAGSKLKSTGYNNFSTWASNESGFSGLPGGFRNGTFNFIGSYGSWWSSSELDLDAWYRTLYYEIDAAMDYQDKRSGLSVRCLKDATPQQGLINNFDCGNAINAGSLTQSTIASGVTSNVPYTGGNSGTYTAQSITSTGVTGLTATLAAGTLLSGAGALTYTITGTPASIGTASFALNIGGQTCTLNRTVLASASITALNCSTATNNGTLAQGLAASSVSSSVPYTGGNGGTYSAQTITSTGVTGLTASLAAGTVLSGAGSLTYTITGTPASSGTASFAISIGGQTCTLTRIVALPAGTITAISCSTATNTGTLTQGVAAASVSSSVPYTGGNGGTYTAQTISSTGVTGLTATLAAGTLLSGAGSLTYTITGTPASSGTASFALNIGGQTCTLTRIVALPVGTITALACSTATNTGTLTQGVAATSVSSSVPYTGGNGGTHTGQTVTSTGVTGLTATRAAGNFATGSGTLVYTITGTPATSGTASFALSVGGQTCTLTRTVALPVGTITALNCSTATNTGTLTQGVVAASVSSTVPYTGGNGGTYTAQTITSTGVTGLTATRAAGTFLSGAGSLTYTITGIPATSGTASFALSIGGVTCTLNFSVTALTVGTMFSGGIIGYIYVPGDLGYVAGETHGIVVAPTDQGGAPWGYGCLPGTSQAFGTGLANTINIVAGCGQSGIAASICYDLTLNGYADWFLPSLSELGILSSNRVSINAGAIANGGTGFVPTFYWSSSDRDATSAWAINLGDGVNSPPSKNASCYVRAVRAF